MAYPDNHPLRFELSDEVHARPPEALTPPLRLSYLALMSEPSRREAELRHLADLAIRFGAVPPTPQANHYSVDLGAFRLRWERHTEFSRYIVIVPGAGEVSFAEPATATVPAEWLAGIPGQILVADHAVLVRDEQPDPEALSERSFAGNALVGASVSGGAALAYTDVRIHPDGFGRLLVIDRGMTQRQAGRTIQRLLEIDTYRLLALLAFPVARRLAPDLTEWERELARITAALARGGEHDEPLLLDRLTRLEAEIDSRRADDHFRFTAAEAYYALVRQRIEELREERLEGLQTFGEFTQRRLAPAMNTCASVAARLGSLSERVARTTQLLSTRVDIARQSQNQAVLESMNRRAALQLRLQETVEGLSVAAITYYIVGLVGYAAKGLKAAGLALDPDLAMGLSIPVVLAVTAFGIRRIRRHVTKGPEF